MQNKPLAAGIKISALLALVATTGCAEYQRRVLENKTPSGSEFSQALAAEYKTLGNTEQHIMYDDMDSWRYYYRASKSADGCIMMPYDPNQWNIEDARMPDLNSGRARMMGAFARGARMVAPQMSAHMQAHYDCWVEQSEEGWQKQDIKACRVEFYKSLGDVEALLGSWPAPSGNAVLFMDGSANLNAEAMRVIDDAVREAMAPEFGRRIHVIGYADAKGPDAMNQRLSQRRAKAVADELKSRGIPADMISFEGKGELPGPQNEADNRRADILFLDYKM